ncbi:ataxin-3-like [Prorops nasuta]|uniref:ataxin-3-like n=1 Tax=Prorops nasuta TaxID=863751 RepID=UPI0034CE970D
MDSIFHEKQEGYLCAQHCLNALLQGPYFNAVDLANFGHQMDEEERLRMAESGIDSEEYQQFLEQPSGNMDDSGYFSVQVISSALKVWGLELILYNSTESASLMAQNDPSQMRAYICNYKGHWFTIRKLGNQWFNLNSLLNGPQLISDTYLAMYLAQLLQEGYSIFIVIGTLPQCEADEVLRSNPVVVMQKSKDDSKFETKIPSKGYRLGSKAEDEDKILKAALALGEVKVPQSILPSTSKGKPLILDRAPATVVKTSKSESILHERIIPITIEGQDDEDDENEELQKALQLSMEDGNECQEDIDKSLKLRLDLHTNSNSGRVINKAENSDEDDELKKALQLSLECVTAPPTPDPEDLRWRRLTYLGVYPRSNNETSPKLNS